MQTYSVTLIPADPRYHHIEEIEYVAEWSVVEGNVLMLEVFVDDEETSTHLFNLKFYLHVEIHKSEDGEDDFDDVIPGVWVGGDEINDADYPRIVSGE
jgi:hypothetical protein